MNKIKLESSSFSFILRWNIRLKKIELRKKKSVALILERLKRNVRKGGKEGSEQGSYTRPKLKTASWEHGHDRRIHKTVSCKEC